MNSALALAALLLCSTAAAAQTDELTPPPLTEAEVDPSPGARPDPDAEAPPEDAGVSGQPGAPAAAAAQTPARGTYSLIAPGEEATVIARGELVVGQTAHGLLQAGLFCVYASCQSSQQAAGAFLLGGLAGGVGSFLISQAGISGGAAQTINSGAAWGLVEGMMLLSVFQGSFGTGSAALPAATSLVGAAVGFGMAAYLHPTGGQVSMVNSGGIWLGTLAGLFTSPLGLPSQAFFGMELVAVNAGLVAGGYLGTRFKVSRGRMILIDVGGVIGGLIGAATFFFANLPVTSGSLFGPLVGVGAAGGLAGAVLLTRGVDPQGMPEVSLLPVGPQGGPGLSVGGLF